ncbi:uncharacterized protein B0H64DRAFT_466363 [Chaetomium fimeti]|uniref:2EXR domain-containing protein n=1 Tax=Chaetomium fimeti TaxID=1854472 RepID=A0AAE0LR27_9PEZI|nr:hypothetical protein B0H64DRAFT_466363 [Chaetomium fimeti]
MPPTFHYFPKLPKSIREDIWACAIRPNKASAHLFTIYNAGIKRERSLISHHTLNPRRSRGFALAAPPASISDDEDDEEDNGHDEDDGNNENDQDYESAEDHESAGDDENDGGDGEEHLRSISWVQGNRSTYLMDAGLWAACRESRATIARRFKLAEWEMMLEEDKNWEADEAEHVDDKEDLPDAPTAAWFVLEGESVRCLTNPRTDLFLLEALNIDTIDWKRIPGLPLFTCRRRSEYRVRHMALNCPLVAGWHDDEGQQVIKVASGELSWLENLWFINYFLRRREGAPSTSTRERYRFYGNGCIFTEVRHCDWDWYAMPGGISVSEFLVVLESEVASYCSQRDGVRRPYRAGGYDYRYFGDRPEIGVLAYEQRDV